MSRKFALIIGNSDYSDKNLACLKTPAADVRALAEVLLEPTKGGFDEAPTLINETDSTIRKAIERFFAKKKSDDLLLLYFSGHGVLDDQGRLYLAAKDTEYELWSASAIPASFITDNMDRSQSKRQVLILDCCHSGAFFRGTKAVTGAKAVTQTTFEGKGYGKVVLTASDTTQYAWEDDQVIGETENSVFTHFLIEGLKTGGADTNNDGEITLDELYDYVYRNLVSATSKQTPRKWAYNQQGEFIIATNPSPVIKPAPLSDELLQAIEHTSSFVREGAVRELEQLLRGRNKGLALAARETLERIAADDDSRRVAKLASEILERNAVVATAVPAPEPQTETEEERRTSEEKQREEEEEQKRARIAALYGEADAAISKKDWTAAVDKLEALLVLNPGHTEAAARLKDVQKEIEKEIEEAKRQSKIAELNQEAHAAEDQEDWATVIEKRQALLTLESTHPESIFKLSYAREQQELAQLYSEGQKASAAHEWSQALRCFEQVQDIKVDYKDVINLIADTQQKIADETKPEPATPTKPAPSSPEPTTPPSPDSRDPKTQQEMFKNLIPVEQGRKLWPLAVVAGIAMVIFIGMRVHTGSTVWPVFSSNTQSSPGATPSAAQTSGRNTNGSVNGSMATTNTSPEASPSATPSMDITKVNFNNFTFDVYGTKVKATSKSDTVRGIVYGDLTGDKIEEAAINLVHYDNPTVPSTEGSVYTMENGIPKFLAKYNCWKNDGDGATVGKYMGSARIESGQLIVKCYSDFVMISADFIWYRTFKWNNGKLVVVANSKLRPNPDKPPD